jgi:hypothetical protein
VPTTELDRVERLLLMHLLEHHGQQVRFEASPWVTEFGIVRRFAQEPADSLRRALRTLEMGRLIYRRTQYVVGYSEPKQVFSLTPTGHRMAVEVRELEPHSDDASGPGSLPTESGSPSPVADASFPRSADGASEPPEPSDG